MFKIVKPRVILGVAVFGVIVFGFQNCSKTNFLSDESASAFKSAGTEDAELPVLTTDEGENEIPVVTMPSPQPSPSLESRPGKEHPTEVSNLIECDLKRPHSKVVFSQVLKKGSNAVSTRACMSEKACLLIVNNYAAARNCNLVAGPAVVQDATSQCTAIFPGSRGTCKNAQVLSDAEVSEILSHMADL